MESEQTTGGQGSRRTSPWAALAVIAIGLLLVVVASMSFGPQRAPADRDLPPVFRDISFAEALTAGREENRLVVVDVMAGWCPPCVEMDRTTWRDERVVSWIGERGVAVQVDADESRDLSQTLGIEFLPTLILFRDGVESSRRTGYQDAGSLLSWFEAHEPPSPAAP